MLSTEAKNTAKRDREVRKSILMNCYSLKTSRRISRYKHVCLCSTVSLRSPSWCFCGHGFLLLTGFYFFAFKGLHKESQAKKKRRTRIGEDAQPRYLYVCGWGRGGKGKQKKRRKKERSGDSDGDGNVCVKAISLNQKKQNQKQNN